MMKTYSSSPKKNQKGLQTKSAKAAVMKPKYRSKVVPSKKDKLIDKAIQQENDNV